VRVLAGHVCVCVSVLFELETTVTLGGSFLAVGKKQSGHWCDHVLGRQLFSIVNNCLPVNVDASRVCVCFVYLVAGHWLQRDMPQQTRWRKERRLKVSKRDKNWKER
jgi:hypothetical protein